MNNTEQKETKKPEKPDVKRLLTVLGCAVLIVFLLIALVYFVSHFFHVGFFAGKNDDEKAKTGVVYTISPDNVRSMEAYDSGVVLLTNSSLKYLDSSGRELESNKHNFSDPVMKVSDKNVFLYDKGSTGYRLEKNTSVYSELSASGPILCGAVGRRGNYAFSVDNDDGFQSHIFVYARNGDKKFDWGSASDYCSALALSDSGGKVAVALLGSDNAEYYSKVFLFSIYSKDPIFTVPFQDETVYAVDFVSSNKLAVFSDRGVYLINQNGIRTAVMEYPANELRYSVVKESGLRAVVTVPYGNDQTPVVTVFNERTKTLYNRQYSGQISGVVCGDSYVGVAIDGMIEVLNRDNTAVGSIDPGVACSCFAVVNHSLYTLTADGVSRYNVHFDTQRTEADTIEATSEKTTDRQETVPNATITEPVLTTSDIPVDADGDAYDEADVDDEYSDDEEDQEDWQEEEEPDEYPEDDDEESYFG